MAQRQCHTGAPGRRAALRSRLSSRPSTQSARDRRALPALSEMSVVPQWLRWITRSVPPSRSSLRSAVSSGDAAAALDTDRVETAQRQLRGQSLQHHLHAANVSRLKPRLACLLLQGATTRCDSCGIPCSSVVKALLAPRGRDTTNGVIASRARQVWGSLERQKSRKRNWPWPTRVLT